MDTKSLFGCFNLDSHGFKQLLDTQSFVDCTLACDGGKICAHKAVLSACSSYLAKILEEHPVEYPIIILPELNIEDVRTLVHYMYTGELLKTNVVNSISLLRTAAILSINSLNDFLNNNGNINNTTNSNSNNNNYSNISNDSQSSLNHLASPISSCSNVATNNSTSTNTTTTSTNNSITTSNSMVTAPNIITNGNYVTNKSDFQFKCPVCQNEFQTICSFEYHMQRIHNVTSFGCEICQKPFASLRYVLTDHMRRCHGWKAEQRLQC